MSDRQCPSCGGFCKKSGCERLNTNHPDYDKTEWKVRGVLAESLKCWCRLTGEEAAELVKLFTETEAQAFAAGAASREDEIAQVRADRDGLYKEWEAAFGERAFGEVAAEVEALRADAESWRNYKARKDAVLAAGMGRNPLRTEAQRKSDAFDSLPDDYEVN